jgi:hypothetical protein
MTETTQNNSNTKSSNTILYVFVFLLLVAILYYAYRQGKKNAEGPEVHYPNGGNDIPPSWSPVPLVDELYDVMSGLFTFSGTKDVTWTKLKDLPTDDMVAAVYSGFNQKYFGEGKGTLTQWIRDEKNYDWISGVKDATLSRLAKINLA